jgi:phage baseplate assembly protein W
MTCVDDLSIVPKQVTGSRRVAESIVRRLSTPRGEYLRHKNYGIDVLDRIQDTTSRAELQRARSEIIAEVLKDRRVSRAEVSLAYDINSKTTSISVRAFGSSGLVTVNFDASAAGLKITLG